LIKAFNVMLRGEVDRERRAFIRRFSVGSG
jgi:hypothetical protein